jgi:hypothetical protein
MNMKNEPVVSYDHMQEETQLKLPPTSGMSFNLYLLFAVDILVIGAIVFAAVQMIF